jgi:hypothetical protein
MRLPPLLRSFSLAAIDDVLADIHGTSRLDFTPTHALTRVVYDGPHSRVYDANREDPWDLVSEDEAGGASLARTNYGRPDHVHHSLETVNLATRLWRAQYQHAFRFSTQSWSLMFPWRYDTMADGGMILSHLKGPNPDDAYYPTPIVHGQNRGWGMSANGNGGACGFLMYGSAGQHNTDFSAFTWNFADGLWRMVEIGYHATRKESWLTVAQRRDKTNSPLAVNILHATASGVGDMTNTDSWFLLGGDYRGIRQANQTGGIGLPLVVFEGTPAENRYAVRIAELPVLQAQLEAYEP